MNKIFTSLFCCAALLALTAPAQVAPADPQQVAFDALLAKGQKTPDAMTAEEMVKLLQLAQAIGRPVSAAPVVKAYFAKRPEMSESLIRLAAENAEAVGDFNVAVARDKQMLKAASPGPGTKAVSTDMYRILVNYIAQPDSAFQYMMENGDRVRASGALDTYDGWFLDRCYEQRLIGPMAKRLVAIFAEITPVDQERMSYYYLDRFLDRLVSAGSENADAIVAGRKLPALIRGSAVRAARTKFLVENLAFRAGAAGKEQAAVDKDFETVLAAAQAYIDVAPKAATARDIFTAFMGGESPSDAVWNMQLAQKQSFFESYVFEKLPDPERASILTWNWWSAQQRVATPQQWADMGSRHVELFKKSSALSALSFVMLSSNPAVYKAQAQFLQGSCSLNAAVINSLAASDSPAGAVGHLMTQESWYIIPENYVSTVVGRIVPAYKIWPRAAADTSLTNVDAMIAISFATNYVMRSPMAAFSTDMAAWAVDSAWSWGGATPEDKSKFAAQIHMLDWVPYSAEERRKVFERVRAQAKGWTDETRRLHEAAKRGNDTNALTLLAPRVALVGPIEEALKQVAETEVGDPAKAPTPICRDLALAMRAVNQKNRDAFVQAGRSLYQAIRDYEVKKTPYGEALLTYLTANRLALFDTFDFQCEIVADQIGLLVAQGGVRRGLNTTVYNMATGRPGWTFGGGYFSIPEQDRPMRVKLNGLYIKGVEDLLTAGKFDAELFNLYRCVRLNEQRDLDLISKMIEQQVLCKNPSYQLQHRNASAIYSYLIRNEFAPLAQKYPVDRYFDDMFADEIRKGSGDGDYTYYGRDEQHKVANAIAEQLGQFTRLPFGYEDQPARYTNAQYWDLFSRAMGADAAIRDGMLAKVEATYGVTRFDEVAAGRVSLSYMPISTPEQRSAFFNKLALFADRSSKAPAPFNFPYLPQISYEIGRTFTDTELNTLASCFTKCWWSPGGGDLSTCLYVVNGELIARKREKELIPMVPMFWYFARETGNSQLQDKLTEYSTSLMSTGLMDVAAVYSTVGLEMMGGRAREETRSALKAIKSKALSSLGGSLKVERSDRRYPLFSAQFFYEAGKLDNAWEQYLPVKELALTEFKDLDIDFSTWLVERHIESGEYEAGEALAQRLIEWMDSTPQGFFDMEARTRLLLAHAGIAFARQEYPRARAEYERIAAAREFENTTGARLAELKIADIDRITKHYDAAVDRLEKLRRRPDPMLQAESNYQLAVIKYDQDDLAAARDYVNLVFSVNMNHANARILEGKLNLKMKKLIEATEVRVGLAADKNTIIPGKTLKVQIEDRNLAVVGRMANIEVRVWTSSGDEEFFSLLPFGDSKTKFEGEIPTALAPQVKGNHILEVLGHDKVSYAFSEPFKKAAGITADTVMTIDVISDAELSISSGKILSKEEQEERTLQRMLVVSGRMTESTNEILSSVRADDEIKPGNPISVRVVDPDRSTTAAKDKITVRAVTASGDSVDGIVLEETDTHSGIFEGKIQTATAPATAFASDSEEGKDPAFAISGSNYPPWVALADNRRPKNFTVDLNNNLTLGRMGILADVPGRLLKSFVVQTSMNGKDYSTVAAWPKALPDWDGYPRCRLVRYGMFNKMPETLSAFKQYLEIDYLAYANEITYLPGLLNDKIGYDVMGQADRMGLQGDGPGSWYIAHVQGVFYVPERRRKTFRLDPKGKLSKISYILTIDGKTGKAPQEVSMFLDKGLHQFDLYIGAQRRSEPEYELQCDIPEAPYMARCPMALFMPAQRPKTAPAYVSQVAKVEENLTNNTFSITFASNTTARLVRIGIADFEGDAPAIRRISLFTAAGVKVLPTRDDVLMLHRNQTLEIVPGDRLSVIYEDPSSVTKEKRVLEAFMKATFYNAKISACFVESSVDQQGIRHAQYVSMRRFRAGDPICVLITDPDGDVSDAQDKLKFTVRLSQGKSIEMEALESSAHSGVFLGRFFPVTGTSQRASELQVEAGEDIALAYTDEQNTDFGIPWQRTCQVEQAVPSEPEMRVYDVTSRLLEADELKRIVDKPDIRTGETMPVIRSLTASRPDTVALEHVATNFIGCPLITELRNPALALSPLSTAVLYVQTSSALKRAGLTPTNAFDASVPGTLKYEFPTGDAGAISAPPGYREVMVRGNAYAVDPLDDGRFTFVIPMRLGEGTEAMDAADSMEAMQNLNLDQDRGPSIDTTFVDEDGKTVEMTRKLPWPVLFVRPDDVITVAYEIPGATNQPSRWMTQQTVLSADAFFDVMDQRYQQAMSSIHVGERVYLRVVDPLRDTTSGKDAVSVKVPLSSGSITQSLSLVETFTHSGIFKGSCQAMYAGTASNSVQVDIVPVSYGDTLNLFYTTMAGNSLNCLVLMRKGANGQVLPFTKRFSEPEVAVQTQFTIAEAYFELAKKQRELKQEDLARRQIAQGKKMLEEAIRDYPETEERAHADYLLANLAMEYAEEIQDPDAKKQRYMEAITRFGDLVSSYPTSPYAPKSQFKKALAFDKLGQLDQACEEYVKLSYRYPDNELVAETIARLGQYFMTKGKEMQGVSSSETDPVKKEKARLQMLEMYKSAARVFERLAVRFPDHALAWKTTVLAAQCWIRAENLDKAIAVFGFVIDAKKADSDLIAQSMYWSGDCYLKKKDFVNAYRLLKRLTWDYPESTWAKYARGRLSENDLARIEEAEATK